MMESIVVNRWFILLETLKARRNALVCAAAVTIMAIGVFHAPTWPVLLGCGGAVTILVVRDSLFGRR